MIETGTGNCHIYVDETADLEMAADIIMNAKTQRVGVCNACESVLVHKDVKDALLPVLAKRLQEKHVEIRADEAAYALIPGAVHATEEDWGKEYLDYILSIKVVSSVEEAIAHINNIIQNIQRQLLPIIMNMHRSFWMRWMLRQFMSMPPHVLQMDLNSVSGQRSVSAHRSFMRGDLWDFWL